MKHAVEYMFIPKRLSALFAHAVCCGQEVYEQSRSASERKD